MTEKRYYKKDWGESYYIFDSNTISEDEFEERVEYEGYDVFADSLTVSEIIGLLNENEELKKELKVYRKLARCSNCEYHGYDWFDDGDEFEVCDKGNDVTERICEDWEEL